MSTNHPRHGTRHASGWLPAAPSARSRETRAPVGLRYSRDFARRVEAKQMNNLLANSLPDGGDAEASLMPSGSASTFSSSSAKPTSSSSNSNAAASTTEPWAARNPMTTTAFPTTTQQQTVHPLLSASVCDVRVDTRHSTCRLRSTTVDDRARRPCSTTVLDDRARRPCSPLERIQASHTTRSLCTFVDCCISCQFPKSMA